MIRRQPLEWLSGFTVLDRQLLLVALAVFAAMVFVATTRPMVSLRERVSDGMLSTAAKRVAQARPIVVAIDRETLAKVGPWPWGRDRLATLVAAVAQAKPRAIAVDILLAGPDSRSPAARAPISGWSA